MTGRRFEVGAKFVLAGITFRVERGSKPTSNGVDQRLDWLTPDGWRAVPMAVGYLLADFFTDNEDILYPPGSVSSQGGTCVGGEKYMRALRRAKNHGWRAAAEETSYERRSQPSLFREESVE